MKKLMILLVTIFFIVACDKTSSNESFKKVTLNDNIVINLPSYWAEKRGIYGDYYTDLTSIVLINEDIEIDNWERTLKESLNFYKPSLISINDNLVVKSKESNNAEDKYYIEVKEKSDVYITSKIIIDGQVTHMLSVVSNSKEKSNEIFKKIFE